MSKFKNEFLEIEKDMSPKLPVAYNFIYQFEKKFLKNDKGLLGLEVKAFNTFSFYPSGSYKPISKIIDLTLFDLKNEDAK